MRILATVLLAVIASGSQAFAQTSEIPRGMVGIGVTFASSDASSRMRLGSEARRWIFSGELGVRVASRVAIGAEAIDFGTATGETSGISFRSGGEQRERAIVGLLRLRTMGGARVALDLAGGAGALFQRHTAIEAPRVSSSIDPTVTFEHSHRAPVVVAGADVPIELGDHLSIAGIARYYAMRRGDNTPDDPRAPIRWQFEHESSGRFSIGGSARVTW
jgi:hypothetical protein